MPAPDTSAIEQSLAKLKKKQSLAKQDFYNLTWQFVFDPDQDKALYQMLLINEELGESLLIFRQRLNAAKEEETQLQLIIGQVYYHYIVNTQGVIHQWEKDDPDDLGDPSDNIVLKSVTEYADLFCVEVKEVNEIPILNFNDEEKECRKWGRINRWSIAWSLRKVGKVVNQVRYGRDDVIPSISFPFDPKVNHHTKSNAILMADFAHLAYTRPVYIQQQLEEWGYPIFHWVEDAEDTDTQVFITQKDNVAVICFRGTSSGTDALIDVWIFKKRAFGGTGKVHGGFKNALDSVWPRIETVIDGLEGVEKIFLAGHSLGAALAQLCAYRVALKNPSLVAGVYVYGSPRVANWEFKEAYNNLLGEKTYLHINNRDAVPKVPPNFLGFHHLGLEHRKFDRGHHLTSPQMDEKYEDKDFEALDHDTQEQMRQDLNAVQKSIEKATAFLAIDPQKQFNSINYTNSDTEAGPMDDHSMARYLFKLACAIVDEEIDRLRTKFQTNAEQV